MKGERGRRGDAERGRRGDAGTRRKGEAVLVLFPCVTFFSASLRLCGRRLFERLGSSAWGQTLFLAWSNSLQNRSPSNLHARNNVRPRDLFRGGVPLASTQETTSDPTISSETESCWPPRKKQRQTPRSLPISVSPRPRVPPSAFHVPRSDPNKEQKNGPGGLR